MMTPADENRLSAYLRGIDIPACPAVLVELDAELRKDAPDQRAIAKLISRDVALSGLVMQVANSPAFGASRQVDSIMQALTVLGLRQMFNLVVTQLLKIALADSPDLAMDRFWDSSATAARVASALARRLRCVKPEMAYTFSLFHDCGIPLLMQRFGNYREVLGQANGAAERPFTAIEEEHLQTSHAVVGYFLARRWKLPEFVAQGILHHHDYDSLDERLPVPPECPAVIALNVLAEHIIRLHARQGEENEWAKAAPRVQAFFGFSPEEMDDLIEDMLDWLEETQASV